MPDVLIRIEKLHPEVPTPVQSTSGAAGYDVTAWLLHGSQAAFCVGQRFVRVVGPELVLLPGDRVLIPTGLKAEIPKDWELQVRPRSGLALNSGVTVLNTPGTIDSDYRGDIGVILINHGTETVIIRHGDRIAQLVPKPTYPALFLVVDHLNTTDRGTGGFGSTGLSPSAHS